MGQIIMILLISILVLVHEAGHFIAARMCGIRVTRFGIGMPFGPSWKMFRLGKTDFYIHAVLFGGYVSFPEDEPENQGASDSAANGSRAEVCEALDGNALSIDEKSAIRSKATWDEIPQEQPENQGASDSAANGSRAEVCEALDNNTENIEEIPENELYENKTILQKLFVVSAGVLMNIVFAFLLVMFCAFHYHQLPSSTQEIFFDSYDTTISSNIRDYDFKKGDKITKINQNSINSFYQFKFFIEKSKLHDDYAQADLIDKNKELLKKLNPNVTDIITSGTTIILPERLSEKPLDVNKDVLKGLERYKNDGIKLTNSQLALRDEISNKTLYKTTQETSLSDIAYALSDTYKPLSVTIKRDDKEITYNNIVLNEKGTIGIKISTKENFVKINGKKDVILKSYDYVYNTTVLMLRGLGNLLLGKVSLSDMHGVIAVVKIGSDVISAKGLLNGLLLTAMISINLAIMNFLPIPALDGGHVMFLLIEKITGKKPSKEFGEKLTNFFFGLLIALMVVICFNDIFALITNKF